MPGDVISTNSTARFLDENSGEERELTLVYPRDATGEPGRVSILAPVGSALLGLRVGQSIDWPMSGNRHINLRVLSIKYQPEARSEEHTSELQSLMRISYAVFCLKKKKQNNYYHLYKNQ